MLRGFGIYIVQKSNLKIMNPISKQLRAKLSDRKKRYPRQKEKKMRQSRRSSQSIDSRGINSIAMSKKKEKENGSRAT
jgi:hypothetical protein